MKTVIRNQNIDLYTPNNALMHYALWNNEPENLDFIDTLLPGQDVFLDLGACEGRYALYAASKGINTFALEPEKRNFEVLLINAYNNKFSNLLPLKCAIGAYNHETEMMVGSLEQGGHHRVVMDTVGRDDLKAIVECREVQPITVISLDKLLEIYPNVSAIKIDVDGSENEFISGGVNSLSGGSIRQLMFELCEKDANYSNIMRQLLQWNFEVYQKFLIEPGLYNIWFKKV